MHKVELLSESKSGLNFIYSIRCLCSFLVINFRRRFRFRFTAVTLSSGLYGFCCPQEALIFVFRDQSWRALVTGRGALPAAGRVASGGLWVL